ncbi:hypothetical protein FRC18_010548 [Serendipita sp. 400]|nr:hypothetical protein FRC18_010548 [Serendipita sp. 400]
MHPAFCTFTCHFYEPLLDEDITKYLLTSEQLCRVMPSAFDSEKARRQAFEAIFGSLDMKLQSHVEFYISPKVSQVSAVVESGGTTDVVKTINYGGGHLALILEEFKVESTGDAYMRICRSYEVLCGDAKNESLLKFGNPTFLLCILGPYLMVCGAVKRKNVHVEPLTPLLPMFPGFGTEGRVMQLAHCLRALKEGTDKLREFWQDVGIIKDANEMVTADSLPEPYLVSGCPDNGLLRFDDWRGTFESRMRDRNDSNKHPNFLAKIRKGDECEKQVVVKFIYNYSGTYGTAVHEYLHSIGLAPALYLVKPLHCGLVMVVMEYLRPEDGTGGWVELDKFEGSLNTKEHVVREKLEMIIKRLQKQKMVHADLRPTNIMIKVDGKGDMMIDENEPILSVVDFDWAGRAGEVCYQPLLNPNVPWPTGAKAYKEIGQDDDRVLLDNWWGAFVEVKTAK